MATLKKNKKLLKAALKKLDSGSVRLCAETLKNGSSYCAVGFLAAFASRTDPKRLNKALELCTAEYGGVYDDESGEEKQWTLGDVFNDDDTDLCVNLCAQVYGTDKNTMTRIVEINDSGQESVSRVERLRIGLRALLGQTKAQREQAALK